MLRARRMRRVRAQKTKAQPVGTDGHSAQTKGRTPKQESKFCEIQMLDRSTCPFSMKTNGAR